MRSSPPATALLAWVTRSTHSPGWPALLALCVAGWLLLDARRIPLAERARWLFSGIILGLALRYPLVPMSGQRIYLPAIAVLIVLIAERWRPRFREAEAA